ncbi:hypothetical protein [Brachyspira catarrhinii]|uniref:Uncharacterized protein n=1 Tax=Brachyspira catarrhinii TaxID=2528966 RepID=A0ABY2TTU5_9SPIR|nr:hypothetical protein [Brachyspira catarrhinii]TKZ36150.1 hypothetical protein EZH24_01600 [Brachyspira catarrhinii]
MGFLFIEPNDPNETAHIFPAFYEIVEEEIYDFVYHTFNDELLGSIDNLDDAGYTIKHEELGNMIGENANVDSYDNEAICHGVGATINDIGNEFTEHYCQNQSEARTYAANRQNAGHNICGNCVRRLYKNDDDN